MKYTVLTVAREYGSGGAEIAGQVAQNLGWRLLDRSLIGKIAARAGVDMATVQACDEHVDSWLHRVSKPLWQGGFPDLAALTPVDVFDADRMAQLTQEIIEEAHTAGKCVIVGRGGQCLLHGREDVFHVFISAPLPDRVRRIHQRLGRQADAQQLIRQIDSERAAYVRTYFGRNWTDPHLYDLMISSRPGCQTVASAIVSAMG